MNRATPKRDVFLFVAHNHSTAIVAEFDKLRTATKGLGPCIFLYHQLPGVKPHRSILERPHYIVTESGLAALGFRCLVENRLFPGCEHFTLILFCREHEYERYWFIEYDVRFKGDWADFFRYFEAGNEDLLTSRMRTYPDFPVWPWWKTLAHPRENVDRGLLVSSLNVIWRISLPALKAIDAAHRDGWVGHHEVLIPTLLQRAGFSMRDFGGVGPFVAAQDRNRFYDQDSVRDRPAHLLLLFKPKNKLYHPVKGILVGLALNLRRYLAREVRRLFPQFDDWRHGKRPG
ncbi:MAG: hypothetical protein HYZ75_14115 [Elusimicrobia bacterium]|nr:hypothetical protein [Elusimicrobiota bacterium]